MSWSGKSVICASLVQHAKLKSINAFYFFCSYSGDPTEAASHILRSFASQIIQEHQDLATHVYDVYFQSHPVPTRKSLLALLPELMSSLGSVRFILDGLDEWDPSEQKEILKDITHLLSMDPVKCICKVLIASRDTLEISRTLRRKNRRTNIISLNEGSEGLAINASIGQFIDNKLSDLPDHLYDLDPDGSIMADVRKSLLEKCTGKINHLFSDTN